MLYNHTKLPPQAPQTQSNSPGALYQEGLLSAQGRQQLQPADGNGLLLSSPGRSLDKDTVAGDNEVVGAEGVLDLGQVEGGAGEQLIFGAPGREADVGQDGGGCSLVHNHSRQQACYSRHTRGWEQERAASPIAPGAAGRHTVQGCPHPFPRRASQGAAEAAGQFLGGVAKYRVFLQSCAVQLHFQLKVWACLHTEGGGWGVSDGQRERRGLKDNILMKQPALLKTKGVKAAHAQESEFKQIY